ncbi:hypothetical protein M426DRAFT_316906 [Hypoxylon sp. CI-4A]|nr:hypothetical protein M426DRAFT_316906 [Hypoxylon sp. CI-4A]
MRVHDMEFTELDACDIITKLLRDNGFPTNHRAFNFQSQLDKDVLDNHVAWIVATDGSVVEESEDRDTGFWQYRWVGMEVKSPVAFDMEGAYEAINQARRLITGTYRTRVNPSCGLHVHVGCRTERFSLDSMQRIASLAWATEHLMVSLNHPFRQKSAFCPSQRHTSNLAKRAANRLEGHNTHPFHGSLNEPAPALGMIARPTQCWRYLAADTLHGEAPFTWREERMGEDEIETFRGLRAFSRFQPFRLPLPSDSEIQLAGLHDIRAEDLDQDADIELSIDQRDKSVAVPSNPSEPVRMRTMPRIANPRYTDEQLREIGSRLEAAGGIPTVSADKLPDLGVWEGARQIYDCDSSCEVEWLMDTSGRANVNFRSYACDNFTFRDRRTIEFRGGDGTLGSWAVTWARICVGLVKFAVNAPVDVFLDVLQKCDLSTNEDGKYDAIDLLEDMGLFAEAAAASKHFEKNREHWNMEFVKDEA